jgi:hypothetical protein
MGQTGTGKSSLLNSLFNARLEVGQVRPTTKEVVSIRITNKKGHTLIFHDMPGIGESEEIDNVYLAAYRKHLLESDVVLWAIHADTRSTTLDNRALRFLLSDMTQEQQGRLMSRITFVLTKVDLLAQSPWGLGYVGNSATFTPAKEIKELLEEKERYFQEQFIVPYGAYMMSWTYKQNGFAVDDPAFECSLKTVTYKGLLTEARVNELREKHPKHVQVFNRLYDNYRVISCSSLFQYNLTELIHVILNKLGLENHESFKQSVDIDALGSMTIERAVPMCNLSIFDLQREKKVFDLSDGTFPDAKNGDLSRLIRRHIKPEKSVWTRIRELNLFARDSKKGATFDVQR